MKLTEVDHRQAPRQTLKGPVSAVLTIGGRPFESSVVDYCPNGVAVRVDRETARCVEHEQHEVEVAIRDQSERYLGLVRHSRKDQGDTVLGIHLRNLVDDDKEVSFLSDDPGWDLIEDAETIGNIFADLAFKGPESPMSVRQFRNQATLIVKKIRDEKVLEAEIFEKKKGNPEAGRASFRFELFQTCHAFEASVVAVKGNDVEIELPARVARLLRRETVRIDNGTNGVFLNVQLHSLFLGLSPEDVEVVDFAEHGISVVDKSGWLYAPKGVTFDSITITTAAGKTIRGKGSIRGHRWMPEREAYAVGIQFVTASDEDRTEWHNAILEARYPSLSFQYSDENHQQIWHLFDRSGYLDLKNRESFSDLIDVTRHTWKRLAKAGTSFSKRAIITHEGTVVGHLQMDRVYPKTWCVHHLAIDPKVSKLVGRELYSMTTDVLSGEGAEYFLSITDSEKSWNQRNYFDFVKTYRFPEHQEVRLFHFYEVSTLLDRKPFESGLVVTEPANKWDHRRIVRFFELYGSTLEREAFSLTASDMLDLSDLNTELQPVGLERHRTFITAKVAGKLAGFLRAESASPGINVFGLFDLVHINLLPEFLTMRGEITRALLASAVDHYRSIGKEKFLVLLDDENKEGYERLGLNFISVSARWMAKCVASRRYHAFANMLFGHLILQREALRKRRQSQ